VYKVYGPHIDNVRTGVSLKASGVYQWVSRGKLIRDDPLRVKVAIAHGRWASWLSVTGKAKHDGEDVLTPICTSSILP